MAVDYFLLLVT